MRFNPDEYITVNERIEKFYAKFPKGRILTAIVEHDRESGFVLTRAEVYREPEDALPAATGHAYELRSAGHVQAGSYVEVCETSSVGRALALLGFEVRRQPAARATREPRQQQQPAEPANIDELILQAATELGYDAAKVRKWVNQKYEVTDGLKSLTGSDKREVLKIFREQKTVRK